MLGSGPSTTLLNATRRHLLVCALILGLPAMPASAGIFVEVDAQQPGTGFQANANNAGNQEPAEKAVYGSAFAIKTDAGAFVTPGAAPSCTFLLPAGCAVQGPTGRAAGEVRGDLGRLKAQAYVFADAGLEAPSFNSEVVVRLQDQLRTLSAGPVTFNLNADVDVVLPSPESDVQFVLQFTLLTAGQPPIEFVFEAPEDTQHSIIDETFVIPNLPADSLIFMTIEIQAFAECIILTTTGVCEAFADAGTTAFIGVVGDVASASGYSYPGITGPVDVPEPGSMPLLAMALILSGVLARRQRLNLSAPFSPKLLTWAI